MMRKLDQGRLFLRSVAAGTLAAAVAGPALATDAPLLPIEQAVGPVIVEPLANSRLGCGRDAVQWAATAWAGQCAFESAVRGARLITGGDFGKAQIQAYATLARGVDGAFTPDQLLTAPEHRSSEVTNLLLVGLKGSAFDDRLKVATEFTRTSRIVDDLLNRDWALADQVRDGGMSASLSFDARLVSTPRFSWTLNGRYRSVSDDFSVGRSADLARYVSLPGTRLSLSTAARAGPLRLTAGLEQRRTPYGQSVSRKAGLDVDGVSLRWVSRDTRRDPAEGSVMRAGRTRVDSAYLDLDTEMLWSSLLPNLGELPSLVPVTISLTLQSGETERRTEEAFEQFRHSSFGADGTWATPLGETMLSYWRDTRTALSLGAPSRSTEVVQASHFVRRGNWTFGLDAAVTRSHGDGSGLAGYQETATSFGQSVAYSAPNGPTFRLQLGQDRGTMRSADDGFAYADRYSAVTASLDLSRYLQKRFERDDLRLTLDYRRALERSDSELSLDDHLVEHWIDGDRREGVLMSFGMKL